LNKTHFITGIAAMVGMAVGIGLMSTGGCSNKAGDEIANINGETIHTEDLHKHLESKQRITVMTDNGSMVEAQVAWTPAFQGLLDLMTRKVVMQMAKDDKVYPNESELTKELEYRKKIDPNYVTARNSLGMNLQQIKEGLAYEMCQERIVTKGVKISTEEAADYIKSHPAEFTTPEELELYYILVNSEATRQKVDSALGMGKPFRSVALELSESPTLQEDNAKYNYRGRTFTQGLPPAMKPYIEKTPEKKRTAWIKSGTSSLMFYVEKRTPAKKMTVDDILKEQVRRKLALQEGGKAVDLQKRIVDELRTGEIKVKGTWEKLWERYIAELKRNSAAKAAGTQ
jgi:hypothetical protein